MASQLPGKNKTGLGVFLLVFFLKKLLVSKEKWLHLIKKKQGLNLNSCGKVKREFSCQSRLENNPFCFPTVGPDRAAS